MEHTGRFFGQIDGTIMDSLVQDRIYKKVAVYDYQGACTNSKSHYSGRGSKMAPLDPLKSFFKYFINFLLILVVNIRSVYGTAMAYAQEGLFKIFYEVNKIIL